MIWNALKIEFSSTWFSTTKESFQMGRAAIEDEPYYLLLSLSLHPIFHSFLIFTYMTKAKGFLSSFHLPLHQMQQLYFSSQILCFAYVQKNSEIKHRWLAGLRWWVLCNDGDCICDYYCNYHAHCNNIYRPGRRFLITNREQFRGQNQMQSLGYYYVYTLISTSQQSIISWKPPTQLKGPPCVSMWST